MPSHDEIMEFSRNLAPLVGREVLSDRRESRVALIGKEMIPVTLPTKIRDLPKDLELPSLRNFSSTTLGLYHWPTRATFRT